MADGRESNHRQSQAVAGTLSQLSFHYSEVILKPNASPKCTRSSHLRNHKTSSLQAVSHVICTFNIRLYYSSVINRQVPIAR